MTRKLTKGQFSEKMRAYHATVAPRQKYQLAYLGDYSGNVTTADPTLVWAHQGDNLFRVSNTVISGDVPAGTPIWIGKSVGVDSKYQEVKRVAYEQQATPAPANIYGGAYLTANQFGFGGSNNQLTSSPVFTLSGPQFVITYQGSGASFVGKTYRNGSAVNPFFYGQCANGTQASPSATVAGDILNRLSGEGYGTSFTNVSTGTVDIIASDTTFSGTVKGTEIQFQVTPNGSVTKAVAVKILNDGRLNPQKGVKVARRPIADVDSTFAVTDYIVAYSSLSAARVVNLPAAATMSQSEIVIKDESGSCSLVNTLTVTPNGGEKIDGAGTLVINAAYGKARLYSNGAAWFTC